MFVGEINSQYYLESSHYVPKRLITSIDKATSSIMANGLHQFYMTFCDFKQKLIERTHSYLQSDDDDDDDDQALTMKQLKRPLILLLGMCAITVLVFIAEIVVYKWNNRRRNRSRTG